MNKKSSPRKNEDENNDLTSSETPDLEEHVGQDTPIAQGDARFGDVPEDVNPGDEFVIINPETDEIVDPADIEELENFASIANTGNLPAVVDSDADENAGNNADEEIAEDFSERQQLGGANRLVDELKNYTHLSPDISGNDVDAAWYDGDQAGEEGVGGSVPTPDQDVVDELGEALGIVYDDDEELNTEYKLNARDEERWELRPESEDDRDEDVSETGEDVGEDDFD